MGSGKSFFDPSRARGPRTGPDVGNDVTEEFTGGSAAGPAPLRVGQLVGQIKQALADSFPASVQVIGEISNHSRPGSGHLYFTLKDASAAICAVMWRSSASRLRFEPEDGLEVVATGKVDVFENRGQLQLYVSSMTPKGAGALELAFRQMREKLQAQGLFDPKHKKPLCPYPRGVGVITSPTGAAIRDIRRTLSRRWPGLEVYLVGVRVQGESAGQEIADAIDAMDAAAEAYGIDTILVCRGGGSLEDLWAFNEEVVARAIWRAKTPIICGVGHEVDVTIAELVADVRAATPTAAAEIAVPAAAEVAKRIDVLAGRLDRCMHQAIATGRAILDGICRSAVFRDPMSRLRRQTQQVDELAHRLRSGVLEIRARRAEKLRPLESRLAGCHPALLAERACRRLETAGSRMNWALGGRLKRAGDELSKLESRLLALHPKSRLDLARQKIDAIGRQLESMSHKAVLKRGFSITHGPDGAILRSFAQVQPGQEVTTELADGSFASRVEGEPGGPGPPREKPTRPKRKTRSDQPDRQDTLF
ncbi:MAG: exodeoxyribonuclease VII large subunit [Phycisphaerae bacterium]